ncbi:MAG TPA: chromosome segregation protein SMC [bacterium]|jgi:chromosome segregation protein
MQLLSLSINGFKSFAKPTRLEFAPGITCVVGPNGCGKSNVVDSLRWVLGEQRSHVLRSDRMENVIFNGTASRNGAGLAEVKITLDNKSGRLNVPYAEVEIARRLYRDGTSEYLLNGSERRLKDITDLLHDSGMGPNLYTILELKMVEDILREDGEGRRTLFEEAAGVAHYKIRRRQALQKLRQTEEDLVRLADIVSEVERQVSSLKRQAMRAKRYDDLTAQMHALEAALAYTSYVRLRNELLPLEQAMQETSASSEAVKTAIRLEEANLVAIRTTEIDVNKDASALRQKLAAVVSEISAMEAEEAGLRARDQSARQTIERARRERQMHMDKRGLLETRRSGIQEAQTVCREELTQAEERMRKAAEGLAAAEAGLQEVQSRSRAHAELLAGLRSHASKCQNEMTQIAMARAGFVSRKEMLQNDLKSVDAERQSAAGRLQELKAQMGTSDAEEAAARAEEARLISESQTRSAELSRLEENVRALASLIDATRSKLELLATLEEKGPRSHSALRTLKSKPVSGLIELLGDTIDVAEEYRRALQTALGPAAYYYLTESVESALDAMDLLRRENAGQTTFLPVSEFRSDAPPPVQPPEGTVGTALGILNGQAQNPVLEHFLGRVVIVKDWSSAVANFAWARDNGCTLVTLDGQWIGRGGLLFGGSNDAGVPVDLGLRRQMTEGRQRLDESTRTREATLVEIRAQRSGLAQVEQELGSVQKRIDGLSARRTGIREQQVKFETRITALDERTQGARTQIADLDQKTADCDVRLTAAQEATQTADAEVKAAEASGGDIARDLSESQRIVATERDRKHTTDREHDAARHRLEMLNVDEQRINQTLTELAEDLKTTEQNAEQAANDLVELEKRLKELDALSIEKYRERDQAAQTVDKASQQLDEIRNRIAEQENRLRNLRDSHSGELEGERRIELEIARLRGELDAVIHSAQAQFNFDLTAEDFVEQNPNILQTETSPELLQECKHKIERLGPVNSLAIEEHARENQRLETMLQQRDDLLKAKKTLEETIARINETAQARFLHTFEAVRSHFQRLFQEFFAAGEADLILSGNDLLEADITLWANPSGKRLKSLSLMSGGEKTMTAIALLFALYHVKPSPFCVFDEVDAPLDDANIDRFNRVIRMHAENTQFILITHNRRTMEIADNLYGVTMEEEGISKLVSVRLLSSIT